MIFVLIMHYLYCVLMYCSRKNALQLPYAYCGVFHEIDFPVYLFDIGQSAPLTEIPNTEVSIENEQTLSTSPASILNPTLSPQPETEMVDEEEPDS